jgi:UDP-galactopyranose mutase
MFDYLIVGAGFAGSVVAERLASQLNRKVLIVDRRPHIGGNAYDHYDDAGVLVHKYGPHIFHTNGRRIYDYLSQFTMWRPYEHHVLAYVEDRYVPFPINIDTVNRLYGLNRTEADIAAYFADVAEPVSQIRTSEDIVVSKVGRDLYEKFFRGYTRKQWGLDPSQLDAGVAARVPARMDYDDRYFTDAYQVMPLHGYTRMFEKMLTHPNIKIMLNTDYREIKDAIPYREMVYTGPIDEFFGERYGKLPYRSLHFRFETHDMPVYQPEAVINYPNDHAYTRVTEFKYLTGQQHPKTSIVYEFPRAEGDPYYPVPRPENAERYLKYKELADATPGVHFVGRLATYKYYNMDQVVGQALALADRIASMNRDVLIGSTPTWRTNGLRPLPTPPSPTDGISRAPSATGALHPIGDT